MDFSTTALSVLLLVAMAIPGFILVKVKIIKPSAISSFSALLLYVCQSFLSLRSFMEVEYSKELALNLLIVFGISILFQFFLLGVIFAILRRKYDNPETSARLIEEGYINGNKITNEPDLKKQIKDTINGRAYRIMTCAATFGNVGFFGIPVLQVLMPDHPEAIAYAAVYVVGMNLMFWTVGSYIITGDKKYVKVKKAIFNPQVAVLVVALPLFFCRVTLSSAPAIISKIISYLADMTAPLSMIILGMRFAVAPLKELFTDWKVYLGSIIKVLIFPLFICLVLLPFNLPSVLKITFIVLSGMPSATMTLNLSEIYGGDQKTAANTILLSTIFSIITIPVVMLVATL